MHTVKKFSDFSFPSRESLVSDIPAGDRKIANLFSQCMDDVLDRYKYRTEDMDSLRCRNNYWTDRNTELMT